MKNPLSHVLSLLIVGALLLTLIACAKSPQARFYMLSNPDSEPPEVTASPGNRCLCVGIGPISIAPYIDRPQIATRSSANQITLAEFDRWSETLKDSVTRMLAQNISHAVCTKAVLVFPWRGGTEIDYRIELHLARLDGVLGGNASIEASWTVYSGDGKKMVYSRTSRFTEATKGKDYHALVVAQSRALHNLSTEIADAVKNLSKES